MGGGAGHEYHIKDKSKVTVLKDRIKGKLILRSMQSSKIPKSSFGIQTCTFMSL